MCVGKRIKKITSIILIIAMVMTGGGVQCFANTVDGLANNNESSESKESLSRKYYDEMMDEKSEEEIENEEKENYEEKDEGVDSQNNNSEDEPEDDGDRKSTDEESEEDESTEESFDETEEGETVESSEGQTEEGSVNDETKSIEESETEVETTSVSDEDNNIASGSEIDADTDTIDEEDKTSTASEADYVDDEEDTQVATASDADEEDTQVATASDAEEEKIHIATYSEMFTVATGSELEELIEEATISEINDLLGERDLSKSSGEVPAIVVWGDVGYKGGNHAGKGYLGMYIGGYDDIGHGQEHGKIKNQNKGKVGLHYYSKDKLKNIMNYEFKHRDEFMIAPQFIKETGWYVQARGRFAGDAIGSMNKPCVLANNYSKDKRSEKSWSIDDLKSVWWDFLKVPFKSYGTYENGDNLEHRIRQEGGDFSILNNNQNIRGYILKDKNTLELVENVKFNNDWAMYEKESTSSWHIANLDDEITTHSNGGEEYDWTTRFNTAYYGIHVTDAEGTVNTAVYWDTNGWKKGSKSYEAHAQEGALGSSAPKVTGYYKQYYTIKVPDVDKNVRWTNKSGKEYKLIGWTEYRHKRKNGSATGALNESAYKVIKSDQGNWDYNDVKENECLVHDTDFRIYYPGQTFKFYLDQTNKYPGSPNNYIEWPITFGPFYRDTYHKDNNVSYTTGSDYLVEGVDYGLADKGILLYSDTYGNKREDYWNIITKVDRQRDEWKSGKGDNRRNVGSVQYNTIFFAPVLQEVIKKTATYDLNGGSWVNSKSSNSIDYDNFSTKTLPGASDVKRTGYTFDGWYTAKNGGNKITSLGIEEVNNGITKLYAHWNAKKYNIVIRNIAAKANTLDVKNGKPSWSEKAYSSEADLKTYSNVSYEGEITLPSKYDVEGFNFVGFNQNKNNQTKLWDGNAKVQVKNLTLNESGNTYIYPVYKEKQISVLLNGGTLTASDGYNRMSFYNATVTFNYYGGFELPTATFTGFNFDGWEASRTINKKTETKLIPANDSTLKIRDYLDWVSFSSTVTFKAKWKEKEYKIEFKGGKATGSDAVSYSSDSSKTETVKYYSKIKLPTDFTLNDFIFNGFGKDKTGKDVLLAKNADVTAGSIASNLSETGTNTLYGRWTEDEVKVTFNGGSVQASDGKVKTSESKSVKKVKLKSKVEIPQDFKLTGFNFKGFNKSDKADSVTLELSDTNKKKATELVKDYKDKDGNLSFYGVWSEKKYSLAIDAGSKEANGKIYKGTGSIAAKVYGYYSNVSMPTEETIKMSGFKLRGFNKEDRQESVRFAPDAVVDVVGIVDYLSMKEHTVENATPSKLYAAWDIAGGTIKFDAGVGYFKDEKREKTLTPDKMGKALSEYDGYEEPAETDDYKFSHWEDKDGNKYYGTTVLIGSIELSAKYQNKPKEEAVEVDTYTIQIINDDNKGKLNGPGSFTIRLGGKILASMSEAKIENPTANEGYTFVGWSFDGQNLISSKDLYTDKTKTEIKAVYIELTITITLSSAEGKFKNGERVKNLVSTKSMALEEYKDYEEPTREGYNFKDWQNGATIIISKDEIKVDTSLVARYTSIGGTEEPEKPAEDTTYTINIINNGAYGTYTGPNSFDISLGAIVRSIMNNYNIKDPEPNDDKVFLGWSWDGSKDNILGSSETYTNSDYRSLEAVYADKTYKVILSAGDGEFADGTKSKELTSNEKVALNAFTNYEEPTKEGYVFKRWTSGGVEVASTSIITKDMTIFANFAKVNEEDGTEEPEIPATNTKYTISVSNDDNKGTYSGSASFEIALGSVILSSMSEAGVVDPEAKDNYKFLGWSWDGNKDNLIKDTDKYVDTTLKTVSAVYDEKTYTVTLSAGDGKFTGGLKSKEITSKDKVALNTFTGYEEPTKEGYVFRRWTKGGVEVASTSVITSDMTLVANFARVIPEGEVVEDNTKYTITILNDDVAGRYTGPTSFELAIGNTILASMSEAGVVDPVAFENYNFLGWSWNGNKENLVKSTDRYLDVTLATISSVYSQDTYTVTLNGGEGVFADGNKTKEIKSNSKIALGEFAGYEVPVRDEYEFMRWLDKDGVEVATTSVITSDIVLFASYKKLAEDITDTRYTVTISNDSTKGVIKVKGVEKDTASFKIDLGEEVLVALASASITAEAKEGYVFKGWSWNGDIATLIQEGDKYNDNRNTSLKAVYTKSTEKTVVLKANTGVFMSTGARTLTVVSENAVKTLESFDKYEEPVKENATFNRWVKEDGTEFAKSNVVTTDLVLYAIYKDEDGNDIGVSDETKDGGDNATYTVVIKSEASKGTLSNATKTTIEGVEYYVALIDVKTGEKILDKLEEKGLTITTDEERWIYEGWSKTNDKNGLINNEDVFDDKSVTAINAIFYGKMGITVLLNANTGLFKETGKRVKEVTSHKKVELAKFKGYEEPVKSEGYKFARWEDKDENKYELTHEFGEESDGKTIELFAIYTDENGNVVGRGDTKDEGSKATYTVYTKYDENKATHKKSSFEVSKDGLVIKAMKDYDAYEAVEVEGWWEKGWSFDNSATNLVDEKTIYDDTTKTYIYAQYVDTNKWTVVLNANTGLFSDNTREKKLENTKKVEIENFEGYEEPAKSEGYKFDRWEDKDGNVYKPSDYPSSPFDLVLYAIYKDKDGNDIGKDDKKDGEINATYTIRLSSDESKGKIGEVKSFEIAKGNYILASMSEAGVKDPTPEVNNYFVGWTWDKGFYEYVVTKDNIYKGNEGTILYALYSDDVFEVTLKANTGIFNTDNSREKILQVPKYQVLKANERYEEPVKTDAKFNRWLKNGSPIGDAKSYMITESVTLDATYSANDGSNDKIGQDDDTEDGGKNATYTIRVINDKNFGQYDGAEYFEIKKGEVIYTTMKAAGVEEGKPEAGYVFAGWKFDGELITALTTYEDTSVSILELDYSNQTIKLTLDSSFGVFKDRSRIKEFNVARGRVINTIDGYEEPTKENWTFSRWVEGQDNEVASTSTLPLSDSVFTLTARYLNKEGVEVSEDSHKHFACGATDEIASHAFDVISEHDREIAYLPVSSKEEFMDYIVAEMAKEETDRKDINIYLEENIELNEGIEFDGGFDLYVCLNGYTLTSKEFTNKENKRGNIYITNCQEREATIVQKATSSNVTKAFFGRNNIHVLSSKGKINVYPVGKLVEVVSVDSFAPEMVELMNVNIEGKEEVLVDRLISADGFSKVNLVDVDIRNLNSKDVLITTSKDAVLNIGGKVNITNNTANRGIVETKDLFNISDGAELRVVNNTIKKTENGEVAVMLLGGENNYVGGNYIVKGNRLELSDEYKEAVNAKPQEETVDVKPEEDENDEDLDEKGDLLGSYYEEISPAGEVGHASAVAFTKENIGFTVGNAKIEICDNESVASDSNIRAEYMYQLRALSNKTNVLIRQIPGTALDENSVIGVAFADADGEGVLTDSAKIGKDVFRNNTFGKEERLLNVKENDGKIELARKTYTVVYHEGTPITNEQKLVIDAFLPDGSTISETTRVRSKVVKAGYDVRLEGNAIYKAKGFTLATYSLVSKNNKELGYFDPRATISYIDSLFGDGLDIEDGDEVIAISNYKEKDLKSEANEPIVVTKEEYDRILNDAAIEAAVAVASRSEYEQVEEIREEDFYTIRYYLNGGNIQGVDLGENEYFEETGVNKKEDHLLITNVRKVDTESDERREYDFVGWYEKNDEGEIADVVVTRINANSLGDEDTIIEVYAQYLPSTYKITYHLEGGTLDGYEGDIVEDTVYRMLNYVLFNGVTKQDFAFDKWRLEKDGSSTYIEEISPGTFDSDIDVYAEYRSALYDVTYHLNGGKVEGITEEDTYVDNKANMLEDYYLLTDVTKQGHRFTGWETANGVKVQMIPAGDTDENKREVTATYAPTEWKIIYDTDGGTIEGYEQGNVTDSVPEGTEYELYKDVKKEGYEFAYWYDVNQPTRKVEIIKDGVGGKEFKVKAKYTPLTYSLRFHIDGDDNVRTINNISNKTEYTLPTTIAVENKEFVNWSYRDATGAPVFIVSIEAGNPNNITDVYASYEDLMTWKIVYHLGPNEFIEGVTEYDATSTAEEKTKTVVVNRRKTSVLYDSVVRNEVEEEENKDEEEHIAIVTASDKIDKASMKKYKFFGWAVERQQPDAYGANAIGRTYKFVDGITKATEEYNINSKASYNKAVEWHYYPYFVSEHEKTVEVEFNFINGGKLPDKKVVDGRCVETVDTAYDYGLRAYYGLPADSIYDGHVFEGIYLNEECEGEPIRSIKASYLQEKADNGEIVNVYVKFTKVSYGLKYHVNGGTIAGKRVSSTDGTYTTTYDNRKETILEKAITRSGYEFDGWRVSDEEGAEKIEKIAKGRTEDIEVYASWKKDSYTVTYVLGGGRVSGKASGIFQEEYSSSKTNKLISNVTKYGAVFKGWYTKPDGKGEKYDEIKAGVTDIENLILYAHYESTLYSIIYILQGGKVNGIKYTSDSYYTLHDNRDEVRLLGEKEVTIDTGKFFRWVDAEGTIFSGVIPKGHVGDIVLYAQYQSRLVDITFNIGNKGMLKGKKVNNGKFTQTFPIGDEIILPVELSWPDLVTSNSGERYEEYYFAGWYRNKDYTGEKLTVIPTGNPENITELYGKWEPAQYQITYHLKGGTIQGLYRYNEFDLSLDTTTKAHAYVLPKDLKKAGCTFLGWYEDEDCKIGPVTKLTAFPKQLKGREVELYAKWYKEKIQVTYTIESTIGSGFSGRSGRVVAVDNSSPYLLLTEDDVPLYYHVGGSNRFDGWYRNRDFRGNELLYIDTDETDDLELFAKIVNYDNLSEEEKVAFDKRSEERAAKRIELAQYKRDEVDKKALEEALKILEQMKNGGLDAVIHMLVGSNGSDASAKQKEEKLLEKANTKNKMFGSILDPFKKLFGDDGDESDEDSTGDEVIINISDLYAYDTVTAEKLGIETPKGTQLDCVVITSITDPEGNGVADLEYIGKMLKRGSNFADIADKYSGHLLGMTPVFVDDRIFEKPNNGGGGGAYYGGGGSGGSGGSGGGGGGGGGRLPASYSPIIVNPYGFDGRGSDNGSSRAATLKFDINTRIGRVATPSITEYKTIDILGNNSTVMGLANETWEYFPASNEFKMFMSAPNGDRYYLTNGWHSHTTNSQKMWYRFDRDGLMQRGFVEEGGKIYYLNNSLNELGHMVKGYKDFEGTNYTGFFGDDGVLRAIFPTAARVVYENNIATIPQEASIDRAIYEQCKYIDRERTRLLRSEKAYGQSAMGNFVGYWYYMASGQKKFRFETINSELQVARFANNGWMNVHDTDNKLYSYRFDDNANVISNATTPEGVLVGANGHVTVNNLLLDLSSADAIKNSGYIPASLTAISIIVEAGKLKSSFVEYSGVPKQRTPGTDIWTVMSFGGLVPVLTNSVYGGTSDQVVPIIQPLQLLSNTVDVMSNVFSSSNTEETVPILDAVSILNPSPLNIVKMTKVLSNVDYSKGIKTAIEVANDRKILSVYGICMDIYNTVKELFAA